MTGAVTPRVVFDGASAGVPPDLGDRHDVERVVQLAVSCA